MRPSARQQAIYNEWLSTDRNILVEAVAGSGKTTTLMEILKLCQYKTLFVAFNKSIQTEIQETIDAQGLKQGKALTMHSLGLMAIRANHRFKIEKNKNYRMIRALQNEYSDIFGQFTWEDKMKLGFTLMDLVEVTKLFLTDNLEECMGHMVTMDRNINDMEVLDINNEPKSVIRILWGKLLEMRDSYYNKPVIEIDFADMIYLPVKYGYTIPVNPYYLMIDEAQDLNLAQHKLVQQLLGQGDVRKFIAVGDRNQSIYGFSGAYSKSFDLFKEIPNTVEMPLDICYRCPTAILQEANAVYDVMKPAKAYSGVVMTITDYREIKEGSMVICRNSGPLLDLFFRLIADRHKAIVKGDDIVGSILSFLKPYQYKTVQQARNKMSQNLSKLARGNMQDEQTRFKYHKLRANIQIFNILARNLAYETTKVQVMVEDFQDLFKNPDEEATVLCTMHKSKGLQADVVYILNEHLIPSKFARSEEQLKQETNLKYVGRSRAKEELYYLNFNPEDEQYE